MPLHGGEEPAAAGIEAQASPRNALGAEADKDRPLREDTRLLGRILDDTVREQHGEPVFDIIERIRQTSVRFRRDEDETARRELGEIMDGLSRAEASQIIRAFGYFSHLANIAEDQHRIRRTRAHAIAASPPRDGSMAHALARACDGGITDNEFCAFLNTASISPVLTAHPTEVRRKSMIDREMEVAHLLAERDRPDLTPSELAANEEGLRHALVMRSGRAIDFYLDELRVLGTELSLDRRLVDVSEALRSPDHSPFRTDEPYRLAIAGIHARLAATAHRATQA
jgi:phosphoenolpyruvate carboxylase